MKKILTGLLLVVTTITSWAYDFSAVAPSGQMLYYNILTDSTCEVTCGSAYMFGSNYYNAIEPTGALEIPSAVFSGGFERKVVSIGRCAFSGCGGLVSLSIPYTISSIGNDAFTGCINVVTLIYNAKELNTTWHWYERNSNNNNYDGYGFRQLVNLETLIIGDSVIVIPAGAFYGQGQLYKVTIGRSVSTIGRHAFEGCNNVDTLVFNSIRLSTNSNWYSGYADRHTVLYNYDDYGFRSMSSLSTIIIGNEIQTLPDGVFFRQTHVARIVLPQSLTGIGHYAFCWCDSISGINIPSTVTYIGSHAFEGCQGNAGSFVLPAGLQSIGDSAFCGWSYLVDVSMGDSVTSIGMGAFAGCYRLSSVTFGNGLENIGDKAFAGCTRLTSPVLPEGLLQIGSRAFDGCTYIEGELRFPSSVTSVGAYAYSGCGNITQLIMKGATPPTISNLTFDGIATTTPVRVPCGAGMNYYLSDNWENFSNIAESPQREIRVSSTNPTMGEATLTQEPTCTNATAIITATAYAGFHFLRWTDGVTSNPRQFTATSDTAFEAMFVANNSYITVHSNDSTMGSVSGSGLYGWNAPVVLQATANSNYHFLRWSDGNTQNPRYLMATQDSVFTAIFVSNISNIQVGSMNPDMGYAIGGGLSYYQNQVSLTAIPNYGYHFVSWSDGNTSNPRTVTVVQDTLFWAVFAVNNYAIHVTSNNSSFGSVSGTGSYLFNTEMSMSASPAYGYHFVQWNDGNIQNPRTITVTRDSMFTAQFAANIYQISTDANDPTMGTAYGAGSYSYNMQISLSATAEYGYHFVQWSDGSTDNPRLVTVTNNASFTALFAINNYTLTVTSSNPAIGTTQGGGNYNYLTPVNISANANTGYHFTQWNDGNTDNPRLVTVTQNATYTAQFAINTYTISVTSNNSVRGMVSGSGTYAHFSQDTLRATPFYGYHFTQWSDGNTDNPRVIVVAEAAAFVAQFEPNMYQVLGTSSDATIGVVSGSGTYAYQSQAPLTAIASDHHHFVRWTDGLTDNPRMVTVVRDTILTAEFAIDQYQLLVHSSDSTRGSVEGGGMYAYMTSVTMTASSMVHNHFVRWSDGNTSNPRIMTMVADVELTALFEEDDKYVVNVMANDSTYGTVSGGGEYYAGAQITIRATAQNHYYFSEWSDGSSENPRVVTVIGNMTYTANFEPNPYVVTVAANDYSMGSVSGGGTYAYGDEVEIRATSYPGFRFARWHDGDTNSIRAIVVEDNCYYQAIFENAPTQGVVDAKEDFAMWVSHKTIVVNGAAGRKIAVYDISGRRIAYIEKAGTVYSERVPERGVYVIKVEGAAARKIVVM